VKSKPIAVFFCSISVTVAQGVWACPANTTCVQYEYDAELRRCIPIYAAAGTPCDDGNACTLNDVCGSTGQCSGTRVTCTQPANGSAQCVYNSCTVTCNQGYYPVNGACNPLPPGTRYCASSSQLVNANACCTNTDCPGGQSCNRNACEYVDPGGSPTACFGMHCCAPGYAVRGVGVSSHNDFLCRKANEPSQDCFLDFPTHRQAVHGCPLGTYLRGVHVDNDILTCCYNQDLGYTPLQQLGSAERLRSWSATESGMYVCPLSASATGNPVVTGLAQNTSPYAPPYAPSFLCSDGNAVSSALQTYNAPVTINPEVYRGINAFPSMDPGIWQRVTRNLLSHVVNLPPTGSGLPQAGPPPPTYPPPQYTESASACVDEEGNVAACNAATVTRITFTYASSIGDGTSDHTLHGYLFLPAGYTTAASASYDGALVMHGHSSSAKDATAKLYNDQHHAAALYLAEHGIVALAPDTASFGESLMPQEPSPCIDSRICHDGVSWPYGLLPQVYMRNALSNMTVLQHYAGRGLFTVGLSLGSWQSMMAAALDTRVSGALAGNLYMTMQCLNDPNTHICQNVPGITNLAARQADYGAANILLLDTPDIGALIAPRQLVVTWGTADPLFKGTDSLGGQSVTCLQNAYMGQYDNGRKIGTYDIYATRFQAANRLHRVDVFGMAHELDGASALYLITGQFPAVRRDYGGDAETTCQSGSTVMHCCPLGGGVVGVYAANNQFLCSAGTGGWSVTNSNGILRVNNGSLPTSCTATTLTRNGLGSCPAGAYMQGAHLGAGIRICCPATLNGLEILDPSPGQSSTQQEGMHACPITSGPLPDFVTGTSSSGDAFSCIPEQ